MFCSHSNKIQNSMLLYGCIIMDQIYIFLIRGNKTGKHSTSRRCFFFKRKSKEIGMVLRQLFIFKIEIGRELSLC